MRIASLGLVLLLAVFLPCFVQDAGGKGATEAPPLTGSLVREDGRTVLTLWGSAKERGFAHGWLLAREIVSGFDSGLRDLFGENVAVYEKKLRPVAMAAFRFRPHEVEELEGMLAGIEARLPDPADRTMKSLERVVTLDDLKAVNVFGDVYALACTSLAVWGDRTADGAPLVVRNFDFPALDLVLADQHLKVVLPPPGATETRGWVGIGYPGGIGAMTVMNREGVFAAIHDVHVVPAFQDLAQGNVPRLIAIRRLAEELGAEGAVEKAAELCRSWRTLYGNNFMVATPDVEAGLPAGILEYDTRDGDDRGVDLRGPDAGEGGATLPYVACTNHHRVRGDELECSRFDAVTGACAEGPEALLGVEDMFAVGNRVAFPDAGKAAANGSLGTLHQVVAETKAARLHVRQARPGTNIRDAKTYTIDVNALLDDTVDDTRHQMPSSRSAPAPTDGPGR